MIWRATASATGGVSGSGGHAERQGAFKEKRRVRPDWRRQLDGASGKSTPGRLLCHSTIVHHRPCAFAQVVPRTG